jgi:hypothetical protein
MAIFGNEGGNSGTGAALDTIQVVNSAVSTTVSAWGSTVPTTFTAASQTLTLPTIAVADIGKSITVQNAGTFPFPLAIASGSITSAIGLIVNAGSTVQVKAVSTTSAIVVSTNASQIVGLASGVVSLASSVPFAAGNNTPATAVTVFTISLTVGSWDISPHLIGNFTAFVVNLSASILCGLFDTTSTLVPGSETNVTRIQSGNAGTSVAANLAGNGLIPVNVTVPGNYTIRVWNNGATGGGSIDGTPANANILGQSRVSYKQTVGALPVSTSISAPQGYYHLDIGNPSVPPNSVPTNVGFVQKAGNLSLSSGWPIAKAGKTYLIKAHLNILNYGAANANFPTASFDLCSNISTTALPNTTLGSATMGNLQSVPAIGAGAGGGDRPAVCIFTPSVDTIVNICSRTYAGVGGTALGAVNMLLGGSLEIIEIGMSAQIVSSTVSPPKITRITSSGTFTRDTLSRYIELEIIGGGGGGGAPAGTTAGENHCGTGGNSGSYARVQLTAAQIGASQAVTIGAGGASGAAGSATSFGALVSAAGGNAGTNTGTSFGNPGAGNIGGALTADTSVTVSVGTMIDTVLSVKGGNGYTTQNPPGTFTYAAAVGGKGADSRFGSGGGQSYAQVTPVASGVGSAAGIAAYAPNTGAGGGGGAKIGATGAVAGGSGSSGLVIITEYY